MAIADLNKTSTNRPIDTIYSGEALNDTASPDTEPGIYAELPPLISKALQPSLQPGESSRQLSRLEADRSNWSSDLFSSMNLPLLSSTFYHIIGRATFMPSMVYRKLDLPWLRKRRIPGREPVQSIRTLMYGAASEPSGPESNAGDIYTSIRAENDYIERDYPFQSTDNNDSTIIGNRDSPINAVSHPRQSIPSSPQLNPKSIIPAVKPGVSATSRISGATKESSNTNIKAEQLSLLTRRLSRKTEPPAKARPINEAPKPPDGVSAERLRNEHPPITGTPENSERPATIKPDILPVQKTPEGTNINRNDGIESTKSTRQQAEAETPINTVSRQKTATTVNGIAAENMRPRIPATTAIQKKSIPIATPPKTLTSIEPPADTVNQKVSPSIQRNTTAGGATAIHDHTNIESTTRTPSITNKGAAERQSSQKASMMESQAGDFHLTSMIRNIKIDTKAPIDINDTVGREVKEPSGQAAETNETPGGEDPIYRVDPAREVKDDKQSNAIKADIPPVVQSISKKAEQVTSPKRQSIVESPNLKTPVSRVDISPEEATTRQSKRIQPQTRSDAVKIDTPQIVKNITRKTGQETESDRQSTAESFYSEPPVSRAGLSPEEVTTKQHAESGYAYDTGQSKRVQPQSRWDTIKINTPTFVKNIARKTGQETESDRSDIHEKASARPASTRTNELTEETDERQKTDSSITPDTRKPIATDALIQPDATRADTPTFVKNIARKTEHDSEISKPGNIEKSPSLKSSTQIINFPEKTGTGNEIDTSPVMETEKPIHSSAESGQIRTVAARDIPARKSIQTPITNPDKELLSRSSIPGKSANDRPISRVPDESEGSYSHEYAGDAVSDTEAPDTVFDKYTYVTSEFSGDYKGNSRISPEERVAEGQTHQTLPFIERITGRAGPVTPHVLRSAVKLPLAETGEIEPNEWGYIIPSALQQSNGQQTMNLPVASPIRTQSNTESDHSGEISRSISDVYREPARPTASIAGNLTLVPAARAMETTSPEPTRVMPQFTEEASEPESMPDIRMIADRVYALLKHDLKIERERERHRLLR